MSIIKTWLSAISSRLGNRRFAFTLATLAVCIAKGVHLHSHKSSIAPKRLILFFFSFFTQDIALLIFLRLLLSHWLHSSPGKRRFFVNALAGVLLAYNIVIGIVTVGFYVVAGSEIHWRNIGLLADPGSAGLLLGGLATYILVIVSFLGASGLLQVPCYGLFGWGADLVNWPLVFVGRKIAPLVGLGKRYSKIAPEDDQDYDYDHDYDYDYDSSSQSSKDDQGSSPRSHRRHEKKRRASLSLLSTPIPAKKRGCRCPSKARRFCRIVPHIVVALLLTALSILSFIRPKDSSLIFLSWTSGLLPFVDFASTSPFLDELPTFSGKGVQRTWDDKSALSQPLPFSWLPKDDSLAGFQDWYTNQTHYSAASDPLKISNLEEPLLESLRDKLQGINVRHVMVILLESTRNDVFPFKKNGITWNRFAETFPNGKLPQEAQDRLATLTPTANFITGDYDDGFEHAEQKKRGGVRFTNAHTAGTYTLKSMVGTICGVNPLVGDFNLEYNHHIYQPCLPHLLEVLNHVEAEAEAGVESDAETQSETKGNWKSYYYQAATLEYDNQMNLMERMGFPIDNTIGREYLRSPLARHGPVKLPNINEFAFEEDPLEEYIRDIFIDANKKNDRVFFTHITSTTHHRFHMPAQEKYVPMAKGLDMMSRYINTEGYDDKWLAKILGVVEEQGVANETLIIFQGDHGVSLPENDIASPYYNPNIGVDHIPLVLSHPQLPAFDAHDAVQSSQILPTILDILLETGSLTNASQQAVKDLVKNYEGQSLVRPLTVANKETGQGQWQFTVTNPGRAMLTVRDARYPDRHLVVPIIENVAWRFSNLTSDPYEHESIQNFDFLSFLGDVAHSYGDEVALWAEEGAFVTRWFVKENTKRWRFDMDT